MPWSQLAEKLCASQESSESQTAVAEALANGSGESDGENAVEPPREMWWVTLLKQHTEALGLRELGIPFVCVGTSEINPEFRDFQLANIPGIQHQHMSLADQLEGKSCALHPESPCCCVATSPECLVVGAPCNPFSVMRHKRFHENSVMQHRQAALSFEGVFDLLKKFAPVTMIVETTDGFRSPFDKTTEDSPHKMLLGGSFEPSE
ncbi:unnamed protein product [Symbiodinium sp. CCMP2592]|nr:unnamed protein product [Symbiodinium sp. CCMP2592]CAE7476879.1 unnamed protein product [Symbiodinium sp. CCMP2592]